MALDTKELATFDVSNFEERDILGCMHNGVPINLGGFLDVDSAYSYVDRFSSHASQYDYSSQVVAAEFGIRVEWRKD